MTDAAQYESLDQQGAARVEAIKKPLAGNYSWSML
jgi:hypothetical protein